MFINVLRQHDLVKWPSGDKKSFCVGAPNVSDHKKLWKHGLAGGTSFILFEYTANPKGIVAGKHTVGIQQLTMRVM